jgi:hypothetical protein
MTTPTATAPTRFTLRTSPPDVPDVETTLTLGEWHRFRDVPDDVLVVRSHEPDLVAA